MSHSLGLQFGRNPLAVGDNQEQTKELATKMGNLTILRKGLIDIVSDGENGKSYILYTKVMYCILWFSSSSRHLCVGVGGSPTCHIAYIVGAALTHSPPQNF